LQYNCIQEDELFDDLPNFSLVLQALSAAMERRAGLYPDRRIPFDDKNVRENFATISVSANSLGKNNLLHLTDITDTFALDRRYLSIPFSVSPST
jgi:hypothetical protein